MESAARQAKEGLAPLNQTTGVAQSPNEAEFPSSSVAFVETSTVTFAGRANDLSALHDAAVDAAGVGAGLWLTYLFTLFYLAIAVSAVTHRDLLFESPVKLPFLGIDLSLIAFFTIAPLLLLIVHAYVLLHFVLLAMKVGTFHHELENQILDAEARTRLRRQLPSNIFVQFLAGPREVRGGFVGLLLRLTAEISLIGGPLALLVLFHLQFLPYHSSSISWWHRLIVLADLALLWALWPSIARGEITQLTWRDLERGKVVAGAIASLLPLLLVFTIATFPGEWLDSNLPSLEFGPPQWPKSRPLQEKDKEPQESPYETGGEKIAWTSLYKILVAGDVDLVTRRPKSLWSNRLVLPGIDVIDHGKFDTEAKIATLPETVSLRGRHLEDAILIDAKLRKVDFSGAHLQGAVFDLADLRQAQFGCSTMYFLNDDDACVDLEGSSFYDANIQNASFIATKFEGAALEGADFAGAWLERVDLRGAWAYRANFQGASVDWTRLEGVEFADAQFEGAYFGDVRVWRSHGLYGGKDLGVLVVNVHSAPMSRDEFLQLRHTVRQNLPLDFREFALRRVERLDPTRTVEPPTPSLAPNYEIDEEDAKSWEALEKEWRDNRGAYEKQAVLKLLNAGCAPSDGVYVIRGWLRSRYHWGLTSSLTTVLNQFLDPTRCPSSSNLSENDKAELRGVLNDLR